MQSTNFFRRTKTSLATTTSTKHPKKTRKWLIFLQELGKSLQFPIAVLPFAAILNRFGALGLSYTSFTDAEGILQITNAAGYWISYIIQVGGATVFNNLALFFAIGIAFGFAKDHRGEVALTGALFYLALMAMTSVKGSLPEMFYGPKEGLTYSGDKYVLDIGVLGGIVAGALSALLYNRFQNIKLPQALSFFGGRRFVPMLALVAVIPVGLLFAAVWPWFQFALFKFGNFTSATPSAAIPLTGVYAMLNRLLLPFGLHQILNTLLWFQLPMTGDIIKPITGEVIGSGTANGDIAAFAKGIAGSGLYQSGFFPIMMGGIPAIALAMIFTAKKENRKNVAGFLGGVALVSVISGITEPIEFSFAFISPLLYAIHALLTGIFMMGTTAMGIQIGFGFSAGLIDYCVSFAQSWGFAASKSGAAKVLANPLWTLLLTAVAGGVYFGIFTLLIKKLDIKTIGREDVIGDVVPSGETTKVPATTKNDKYQKLASAVIDGIGKDNFVDIDNCATRLRLKVKDSSTINQQLIKNAGAFGIIISSKETLQIVIGTDVEHVTNLLKSQVNLGA